MNEFLPCEVCTPERQEQCAMLRRLVMSTEPMLSTKDMVDGETVEEYAYRLAAHKLAVRILERVSWSCVEFIPDCQRLTGNADIEAYADEL